MHKRVLRNESDGVTWTIERRGAKAVIEIRFDDDPDGTVTRERVLSASEIEALIAEQLTSGFTAEAPSTPTPEWIAGAGDHELALDVVDAWLLAAYREPSVLEAAPDLVRSFIAVHTLVVQCGRNGLSSFLQEDDVRLVLDAPRALRALGFEQMASLFERATRELDLRALSGRGAGRLRWSDAGAAAELERLATQRDVQDALLAWVRAHAVSFAAVPRS